MDIIKIIGIGLTSLIVIVILKQYKPEFVIYVSILTGAIILFLTLDKLSAIINLLTNLSQKANVNSKFLGVLLKITGIAILSEYAISICKDSGESAIANKIDIASRIIIIGISIPIITVLLETIIRILP